MHGVGRSFQTLATFVLSVGALSNHLQRLLIPLIAKQFFANVTAEYEVREVPVGNIGSTSDAQLDSTPDPGRKARCPFRKRTTSSLGAQASRLLQVRARGPRSQAEDMAQQVLRKCSRQSNVGDQHTALGREVEVR